MPRSTLRRTVVCFSLLSFFLAGAVAVRAHTIVTTRDISHPVDTTQFQCRETVYVHVKWSGLAPGRHEFGATWINPSGAEQDHSLVSLSSTDPESWLWIKLEPSAGSSLMRIVDPDRGAQNFVGNWRVDLTLDGKPLESKQFNVAC